MKKIFFFGNPRNTVWDESQCNLPFERTKSKQQADIWVATQELTLQQQIEMSMVSTGKRPKACILWTHEPYFSVKKDSFTYLYGVPTHIFNIWNHNSLFQNGTFLWQNFPHHFPEKPEPRKVWRSQKTQKSVALITYPNTKSLATQERVSVALDGYSRKVLDIYGKGWPDGISLGNSRDGEWWKSKPAILEQYDFNLAMENCLQPYYVSEKIWDSLLCGCLPIYADNGSIYQTFPKGSFLDIKDYTTTEKLWKHIEAMSMEEWNKRFSSCWDAMKQCWDMYQENPEILWNRSKEEIVKVMEKI